MKSPRYLSAPGREARNRQRDFLIRLLAALLLVLVMFGVLGARFFYLQISKYDEYTVKAATNRISLIPTAPVRGEIVDANGVVLARNDPA